ncbi:hypothetical protein A9264_13315 [Vibrio sp. UCD-FRSSP16_10]|uniref:hypothetical protein n=1 Tax=unclassified Vibrio TaxID=2614977 RepID=UPI0007FF66B5|nr:MULTISPECIES: hypothetical protein [unclassified Vibrio]OBT14758.1 hypothetical protein A9260_13530 [Vibrio sp. UCD-FRSSP16_30]OBT20047.1 hypothetical protein A9264_13315 [Vibrio sp. UCD-FRSSP16_10]
MNYTTGFMTACIVVLSSTAIAQQDLSTLSNATAETHAIIIAENRAGTSNDERDMKRHSHMSEDKGMVGATTDSNANQKTHKMFDSNAGVRINHKRV